MMGEFVKIRRALRWSNQLLLVKFYSTSNYILFARGPFVLEISEFMARTQSVYLCFRTDVRIIMCVCVCAYMREDDEWIRASSLNTSTVVYE